MADWSGTPKPEKKTEERPERQSFIRLGENGVLQMVRPKPETSQAIEHSGDTSRISNYFKKVFSSEPKKHRPSHEVMDCFYCADKRFHHVHMEVADGIAYSFSFACVCSHDGQAASIMGLVSRNLFTLECAAWQSCQLPKKASKCTMFNCRRFP